MNVFDFDKTIYFRESTTGFYRFCIPRRPIILLWLPVAGIFAVARLLGLCSPTRLKEAFHGYLRALPDAEALVEAYWDRHMEEIPAWMRAKLPEGGFVISASPEFIIAGLCRRLGLPFTGTRMDIRSGKISGKSCKGEEKPLRFRELFPDAEVEEFYSDSLSDTPMARLAQKAYLVKGERLSPWPPETL